MVSRAGFGEPGQSVLKSGLLQTTMLLISHPDDDDVSIAVRLAWLIQITYKREAQAYAVEALDGEKGVGILESCRMAMKKFRRR